MKRLYFALAALGVIAQGFILVPWIGEHGVSPSAFFRDLFASSASTFFVADVVVAAIVLFVFIFEEKRRGHLRNGWIPVIATLLVGLSAGLPLLLALREGDGRTRASAPPE